MVRFITWEEAQRLDEEWRKRPAKHENYVRDVNAVPCPHCGIYPGEAMGTGDCGCEISEGLG